MIKQRTKRKITISLFITVSLFILFSQIALGFNEQQVQNESNASEPLAEMEQAIIEIKKSDEPVPIIPLIPTAAELTEEQEKYVNLRIDEKNRAIDLSLLHFRSKHKLRVNPVNKEAIQPLKASGRKYQL